MIKKLSLLVSALFTAVVVFSSGYAQTAPDKNAFPGVKIKNFGQMDERFFRGARPKQGQVVALKELGVDTVIDLTEKPKAYEKIEVEAAGMKYVHLPMVAKAYPTEEALAEFARLVDDPATGTFFLHCAGGRHRTGVLGAAYRFNKYGWDYDRVYAEMKNYDFYTRWGHGRMKDFVGDYAARMDGERPNTTAAAAAGAGSGQ